MATISCSNCGTENPSGARFCMSCGTSFETPCPECATPLPPGARFCFNCGHERETGATAAQSGRSAQQITSELAGELRRVTSTTGERRRITMLFCDVAGSTAAAEQLDPEAWTEVIKGGFDRMIRPVERYGGTVARLLGDAILAYFGAPVAHEDDPQRAVLAALAIQRGMADYARDVQSRHGIDFGVRIGINTGLVVVGDVGSELYGEYAALGDAANVAARMEQTAEPGTIRISESTHRLVAPVFDTEAEGSVQVKGKDEPVPAYRVVGARATPGRLRGIEGLHSPIVGRDAELQRLRAAVFELREGRGRIASLIGEAGLGKSRLAADLRHEVEAAGEVTWLQGQSMSYETSTPYSTFMPLLLDLFDLQPNDGDDDRYRKVQEVVRSALGDDGAPAGAYLATVVGIDPSPEDAQLVQYLEPPHLRRRVFTAVGQLLTALARQRPLIIALEDLHWADATSIELVESLLPLTDDAPLLVLALFRPRRDEPSWSLHEIAARDFPHRYTAVELQPLDAADAESLIANLLEVEGLSDKVRRLILAKAEGNPFFVEEVIRSMLDTGMIVREDERFVATADIEDVAIPDTLAAVLNTRLDSLPPANRQVLQAASVIGREFSVPMLQAITDPTIELGAVLTDLQRRELIRQKAAHGEPTFSFKHALTRDAAYDTLLLSVRRDLHRLVGKLIEELHPDQVNDLARHFLEADEPDRALPYLVEAGDRAFKVYSMEEAMGYYRKALDAWDERHDISLARRSYEGLGGALGFLQDVAESMKTFEEMRRFGQDHDDIATRVSAMNKMAMGKAFMQGQLAEAEMMLDEARALAEQSEHLPGLAEGHVIYCSVNTMQGKLDAAAAHLSDAAQLGLDLQSPFHRNYGLTHYASTLLLLTRYDEAEEAMARAREQAEADGDIQHLSQAIGWFGAPLLARRGKVEQAADDARGATEMAARVGAFDEAAGSAYTAAYFCTLLGRYEEARRFCHQAVEYGTDSFNLGAVAMGHAGLAAVEQAINGFDSPQVLEHIAAAREVLAHPLAAWVPAAASAVNAYVALERGAFDLVEQCLADDPGATATARLARPEMLICSGGLALARGDMEQAEKLTEEAYQLVEKQDLRHLRPRVLLGKALLTAAQGDLDQSVELATEADRLAGEMKLLNVSYTIRSRLADVLEQAGRTDQAAEFRRATAETVAELASLFEDAELRRSFLRAHTA